jgi:dGTPase
LPDPEGFEQNLDLTYAVRDGIICHCGEIDDKFLSPREDPIDLLSIEKANQYSPYTWEGCVVKVSDKISYLGRDIEDAITLKILSFSQLKELSNILKATINLDLHAINNTVFIHKFIIDLCNESSPEKGIKLSAKYFDFMKAVKEFNYANIYKHSRLTAYIEYANLVIKTIYMTLIDLFDFDGTFNKLERYMDLYPTLISTFLDWLIKYSDIRNDAILISKYSGRISKLKNKVIYKINERQDYIMAIVDYISGMTDSFAIRVFNEIMSF